MFYRQNKNKTKRYNSIEKEKIFLNLGKITIQK